MARRIDEVARRGSKLCLPTGSTPKGAYGVLAETGDMSGSAVFLLDEFVLPEGAPARCDSMLRRDLLDSMALPPATIETWTTSGTDLDVECARMEASIGGSFDVAIVGIGSNGHLGLNEPGSAFDSRARVVDLSRSTQDASARYGDGPPPEQGVTFGLGNIMEADAVWLIATGDHKTRIVADALTGPVRSGVPASVLQEHPNLEVFLDEAAASML